MQFFSKGKKNICVIVLTMVCKGPGNGRQHQCTIPLKEVIRCYGKKSDCSSAYLMQEDAKGKSNFSANCFASSKRKCRKYVEQSEIITYIMYV